MPVYTKFYFYSITNPEEFQLNHAKPILEEKGPYVFRWDPLVTNWFILVIVKY